MAAGCSAQPWERATAELLADPWAARDGSVALLLDRSGEAEAAFFAAHAVRPLSAAQRRRARDLLELQRNALRMFTSCGWFFDDVERIETIQILQYAARAEELARDLLGVDLEPEFLARLARAPANGAQPATRAASTSTTSAPPAGLGQRDRRDTRTPCRPARRAKRSPERRPATRWARRPGRRHRPDRAPRPHRHLSAKIHAGFPLARARELVPYLDRLGVSHLYSSPLLVSRLGSSHGYDVIDPTRIDPEVGGEAALAELRAALDEHGLGLVLDIVPNHVAASPDNPWWYSLLVHGRRSPYAAFFDVDWERERDGRLLLPILGAPYGDELAAGNVRLDTDLEAGFRLAVYERRLPLTPRSLRHLVAWRLPERRRELGEDHPAIAALSALLAALGCAPDEASGADGVDATAAHRLPAPRDGEGDDGAAASAAASIATDAGETVARRLALLWRDESGEPSPHDLLAEALAAFNAAPPLLDRVIREQPYRPAVWRLASEAINYRRFFDVAGLAALRQEDEAVFAASHELVLRLVHDGTVDGLRVDHVDGLRDPGGYLRRLQQGAAGGEDAASPLWVVVEKILAADEALPPSWPVAGTTGYDFQNSLTGVFVDPHGLRDLDRLYARFTGELARFEEVRYQHKRQALKDLFPGELAALTGRLDDLAAADLTARDLPPSLLARALLEVTACLPVYRTYAATGSPAPLSARDATYLDRALAEARQRTAAGPLTAAAFGFLARVLHLDPPPELAAELPRWRDFVARWQQLTGPAMAKGLEDTALYVYNRLISLNAVGGEPEGVDRPGDAAAFHRRNAERSERWPHGMTCTSTHDAKRSEDVRARISVLSELAERVGGAHRALDGDEPCPQARSRRPPGARRQRRDLPLPDPGRRLAARPPTRRRASASASRATWSRRRARPRSTPPGSARRASTKRRWSRFTRLLIRARPRRLPGRVLGLSPSSPTYGTWSSLSRW